MLYVHVVSIDVHLYAKHLHIYIHSYNAETEGPHVVETVLEDEEVYRPPTPPTDIKESTAEGVKEDEEGEEELSKALAQRARVESEEASLKEAQEV